jgi:hypothetical protein
MVVAALLQVLPRDGLSIASDVAIVVVGVAIVVLAVVGAAVLLRLNRTIGEIRIGVRQNLGPVSDRARSISANVEFITQALRTDVERLNASVKSLTDRLQLASDRMEERIEEFNALMEVVQDEAEGIFLDTASTVHGVRAGARSIASGRGEEADSAATAPVAASPDDAQALAAEKA